MKRLLFSVALAGAGAAFAQAPGDFSYRADVTAGPGLNVVTLSEPVYRAAQTADLRDLRFFNAKGETLPFASVGAPPLAAGRTHDLAMVTLPVQAPARDKLLADFALRIEKSGDRAVVELSPVAAPPAAAAKEIGNFLLDLRPYRGTSGEVLLRFAADAPDFAGRVELLGSDDLSTWRPLASAALVRNRQFGDTIERNVVAVASVTPFVRVAWTGSATAPRLAGAQLTETANAPALPRTRLAVSRGDKDGSWFVEVPPALPIARVFLRPPSDNLALTVRVFRFDDHPAQPRARLSLHARRTPERWIVEGAPRNVYRLNRGGEWIDSAPFTLSARTTQLRLDAVEKSQLGEALPIVEVEWQPQRVVVAATGPAPYVLAVGNDSPDLKAAPSLDLRSVLPPDDPSATRLPVAALAATAAAPSGDTRSQRIAREASWSRYVLWGGLAAAVVALAFMAWKLAAQLKSTRDARANTGDEPGV